MDESPVKRNFCNIHMRKFARPQIYGLSLHDWTMSRSQHELLRRELAPQEVFDDSATGESRRGRMKRAIVHSEELITQRIGIRPTESTVVFAAIKGW
jgi:hypothetical protein